jgi:hypothetical protein
MDSKHDTLGCSVGQEDLIRPTIQTNDNFLNRYFFDSSTVGQKKPPEVDFFIKPSTRLHQREYMWCRELEQETQEKKDDVPNLNIHFYPSASRVIDLPVRGSKHFLLQLQLTPALSKP